MAVAVFRVRKIDNVSDLEEVFFEGLKGIFECSARAGRQVSGFCFWRSADVLL